MEGHYVGKKSRGPRAAPWGTPDFLLADSKELPSTTTFLVLLVRKIVLRVP